MKRYTEYELNLIRRLRQRYKPSEISQHTGRTLKAIESLLMRIKRQGADFPKLPHGNRKYTSINTKKWREQIMQGKKYREIQEIDDVHPKVISRILAMEGRGELHW